MIPGIILIACGNAFHKPFRINWASAFLLLPSKYPAENYLDRSIQTIHRILPDNL
jgi:hypothetical protein